MYYYAGLKFEMSILDSVWYMRNGLLKVRGVFSFLILS